jgi:hypothetical protein
MSYDLVDDVIRLGIGNNLAGVLNNTGFLIQANKAVYVYDNAGVSVMRLADAGSVNDYPCIGFTVENVTNGSTSLVQRSDILDGFSSLNPGAVYYLDPATPGGITATATTTNDEKLQIIGYAVDATKLLVAPGIGIKKLSGANSLALNDPAATLLKEVYLSGGGGGGGIGTINAVGPDLGGNLNLTSTGSTVDITNTPLTNNINLDLPASGVTAASYTLADITVNAEGIITAAANGSISSGINPTSISDLISWWKADAITGLVNNDPVSLWDQSAPGSSHTLTGSGGSRPIYKTNVLNSLPGVYWAHNAKLDSDLDTNTLINGSSTGLSVVMFCQNTNPSTYGLSECLLGNDALGPGSNFFAIFKYPGTFDMALGAGDGPQYRSANVGNFIGPKMITAQFVPGTGTLINVDNYNVVASGFVINGNYGNLLFGDIYYNQPWYGYIYEIIVYSRVLKFSELTGLQNYLASKWGI